jgi:hypothetical protein
MGISALVGSFSERFKMGVDKENALFLAILL